MMEFLEKWVLKPEYLPAWLQAAAAIIALAISVWAVWWASAASRLRDRLELRGIAVAIYPEIEMLAVSTGQVREGILAIKRNNAQQVGQGVAATLQVTTKIPMPPMMERNIDRLLLLGEVAGPSCVHLARLLIQYNEFVDRLASHIVMLNTQQWPEAVNQLEGHLSLLDGVMSILIETSPRSVDCKALQILRNLSFGEVPIGADRDSLENRYCSLISKG